jgi:hypothetical protein
MHRAVQKLMLAGEGAGRNLGVGAGGEQTRERNQQKAKERTAQPCPKGAMQQGARWSLNSQIDQSEFRPRSVTSAKVYQAARLTQKSPEGHGPVSSTTAGLLTLKWDVRHSKGCDFRHVGAVSRHRKKSSI